MQQEERKLWRSRHQNQRMTVVRSRGWDVAGVGGDRCHQWPLNQVPKLRERDRRRSGVGGEGALGGVDVWIPLLPLQVVHPVSCIFCLLPCALQCSQKCDPCTHTHAMYEGSTHPYPLNRVADVEEEEEVEESGRKERRGREGRDRREGAASPSPFTKQVRNHPYTLLDHLVLY